MEHDTSESIKDKTKLSSRGTAVAFHFNKKITSMILKKLL